MRVAVAASTISLSGTLLLAVTASPCSAQTALNLNALQGLAAFSTLPNSVPGQAALASNFTFAAAIQTGSARQPLLQPFKVEEAQALKDAFITGGNALQLTDGLGSKLGDTYHKLATYTSSDDGLTSTFTSVSDNVASLLAYASGVSSSDSGCAKFFFANGSVSTKDGTTPPSPEAASILATLGGVTDVYGKAYNLPVGQFGADPFGDSRPFQTEKNQTKYDDPDYFEAASKNTNYLTGPIQNLVSSPAFPSGHTTYGYTESLLLAVMVPERYQQMIVRAAEYGNDRILLGAHYPMDVIGGRTLAYYDVAHLLANNPAYIGRIEGKVTIADFNVALEAAKADLVKALETGCGDTIANCVKGDDSRFGSLKADEAFYESTQTYGLATAFPAATKVEDVAAIAPEAGYLLTAAFPTVTIIQADKILTDTEGPAGGFLDNGSPFGVYSRLDLYRAGRAAAQLASTLPPPTTMSF